MADKCPNPRAQQTRVSRVYVQDSHTLELFTARPVFRVFTTRNIRDSPLYFEGAGVSKAGVIRSVFIDSSTSVYIFRSKQSVWI